MNIFSGGKIGPLAPSPKTEAAYKKPSPADGGKAGGSRPKTDTIELSGHQPSIAQKQLPSVGSAIMYEVSKSADQQRLDALRSSVSDGSYLVPAKEIARSMLGISL